MPTSPTLHHRTTSYGGDIVCFAHLSAKRSQTHDNQSLSLHWRRSKVIALGQSLPLPCRAGELQAAFFADHNTACWEPDASSSSQPARKTQTISSLQSLSRDSKTSTIPDSTQARSMLATL